MTAEPYAFWRAQLAGKPIDLNDKLPRCGFYRKSDQPIAIWMNGDEMVAKIGNGKIKPADAGFAEQVFAWCCRHAISHEVYTAVLGGAPWPDAPPDVKGEIGDNLPSDPFERLKIELEAHQERVTEFLKTPIRDEEAAVKAGLWSGKIAGLSKEFVSMFKSAKRPHDEALKEVKAKFEPRIDLSDDLTKKLKLHMKPWLEGKKARAEAEAAAKRDAEKKAAESLEMPAPAPREIARQPSKVVTGGVKLVTRKDVKINNVVAAASFFAAREKVDTKLLEVITTLARREALAGYTVPGVEVVTIESVA